ncbi:MAG: TRAP transporter small permease [Paracoccaceae bacterium]|nr:TRAP transporter small permease [Paracoccaceae bacterium]MDP5347100.1 TRAP transporter small permease [Paracoccaceae bacterium]
MSVLIKVSDIIIRLTHYLAAAMLAVAAALVFYQVLTRFILNDAAVWSEVLARAVIVWGVFLIMGPAIRHGKMIPIDVLRSLLPQDKQIWIIRIVTAAIALFLCIHIWYGYKMTLRVMNQQVAMLNVSVAWFYVAIPVGAVLALPGLFLAHVDAERGHLNHTEVSE